MTPYDVIWYSLALLVASIPTTIGLMFIGAGAVYIKREWNKK